MAGNQRGVKTTCWFALWGEGEGEVVITVLENNN